MNKLVVVLTGFLGLAAACGDNVYVPYGGGSGTSVTPSASGVFPAQGFTGASLRVEISGDATAWTSGATVDFGSGVTVNDVSVASPTDLFADITIDPAATPGKNDVTISSGGTYTLAQAFELVSPVSISFTGTVAQGGLVSFVIDNHNFDQLFDASTAPALTGPAGINFSVQANDELSISGYMFIDTTATGGPITVQAGSANEVVPAIAIAARTATALTSGTAVNGTLAIERDSGLYTIDAGATDLLHFSVVAASDPNAQPFVAVLPASGSWADEESGDYVLDTAGTYYAVVADNGTEGGYAYTLTGTNDVPTVVAEGNDTTNGIEATAPVAAALPYEQTPSTLSSADDVDIVTFTVDAANANATVHILTNIGSDPETDTQVEVVDADGNIYTTGIFGEPDPTDNDSDCDANGDCANLGEDTVTAALPAGTYYLEVSAGADYSTADKAYSLLFWFE